jgi:hypothetical protein
VTVKWNAASAWYTVRYSYLNLLNTMCIICGILPLKYWIKIDLDFCSVCRIQIILFVFHFILWIMKGLSFKGIRKEYKSLFSKTFKMFMNKHILYFIWNFGNDFPQNLYVIQWKRHCSIWKKDITRYVYYDQNSKSNLGLVLIKHWFVKSCSLWSGIVIQNRFTNIKL